jgi:UDP-N-acetylmuramoyl-L-alanyl-D-glutamate--2,6-diaminopimelate ligase
VDVNDTFHAKIHLPGNFNVSNALAAVGVGMALELSNEEIAAGLAALMSVEGRMNTIDEGQDFSVIVDFAHTPDSFEKILSNFRLTAKGRLIVLFGSAGRRDEAKRSRQGGSAGKYADIVVVTEEDDRDVDGQKIMEQIAGGAAQEGKILNKDLFLVHDRTAAIRFAIGQAQAGDTVLLLGKGHEKTIERADGEHPWDEPATAREAIREHMTAVAPGTAGVAPTAPGTADGAAVAPDAAGAPPAA